MVREGARPAERGQDQATDPASAGIVFDGRSTAFERIPDSETRDGDASCHSDPRCGSLHLGYKVSAGELLVQLGWTAASERSAMSRTSFESVAVSATR